MANKTVSLVEDLIADFLKENDLFLWDAEFVKEGRDWYLRLFIDRTDGEYVSTDDCEMVSEFLSKQLDERDPIEQNYYLEVSSPGMDRPLVRPEHYERYVGEEVEIRLYKSMDGVKNIQGVLEGFDRENSVVTVKALIPRKGGKTEEIVYELSLSDIAKANLAVVF